MAVYAEAHVESDLLARLPFGREELAEMIVTVCEGASAEIGNQVAFYPDYGQATPEPAPGYEHRGIFLNRRESDALAAIRRTVYAKADLTRAEIDESVEEDATRYAVYAHLWLPESAMLRAALAGSRTDRLRNLRRRTGVRLPRAPEPRTGKEAQLCEE